MNFAQHFEEQGHQEAEKFIAKKIAIKLLQMAKSIDEIAYLTELPVEIVRSLAEENPPT